MTATRAVATASVAGDEALAAMLRAHNVGLDPAQLHALIRGVAAAPPPFEPDAWMTLVADEVPPELHDLLARLLAEEREQRLSAGVEAGFGASAARTAASTATRVAALRAELRRRRLGGFVVPRGDEHQGEYVAARSERLSWLTGFTGSAGVAVVLRDHAALFVDGRYTAQAAAEVDTALFEIRHITHKPMNEWLAAAFAENSKLADKSTLADENKPAEKIELGYDPWLHTPSQAAALQLACGKAQARAVAVEHNPIDAIWDDQPPPPIAPIVAHDLAFAGTPSVDKRVLVAATLQADKQHAAFLAQPDSIAWLLNIRGGDIPFTPLPLAFALVQADAQVQLFTDPRKLNQHVLAHLGDNVTVRSPDELACALRALATAGRTVRLDPDAAPEWVAHRLRADGAIIAEAADPCALPKATKSGAEIAAIRAAHRRDGAALSRFLCWLQGAAISGGVSESAAAERLAAFRAEGAHYRGPSFPTISAAAGHGAIVHYRVSPSTDAVLAPDSLYLVDSGAQYLDGTTDVTRTVCIGKPDREMRERYTLVLKGHIAIAAARFPRGTTGSQIDALARVAMWRVGLDYDHGTGHGVGFYLGVHEGPQRISKLPSRIALQPGMVVSNEPGYYKQGAYGIRIENLVVVTSMGVPPGGETEVLGFETLTLAPLDARLIDYELLEPAEIDWLDGYHQQVWESLSPLLDASARDWLEAATQPVRLGD